MSILGNHPKGLYALALANTGERFGYYTMIAIFVLYLQAKYGFSEGYASTVYGGFLAAVYFMPLIGGILADRFGYGKMISYGFAIMFAGYLCLSLPLHGGTFSLAVMFAALFLIAMGTGLFKGNLQVLMGNLYDEPRYSSMRDTAFSIFYMAINLGAFFAPSAANAVTDYFLTKKGFVYDSSIPALAHQYLDGTITEQGMNVLNGLKEAQQQTGDMATFCNSYITAVSDSYSYSFAVACLSLIVSVLIYRIFRKTYIHADCRTAASADKGRKAAVVEELTPEQTRKRIVALLLVFAIVIFFWMAFHQNGLTMTLFARDYTAHLITGDGCMWFDTLTLTCAILFIYSLIFMARSSGMRGKTISASVAVVSLAVAIYRYFSMESVIAINPSIFQQFNPFFVIVLTPLSVWIFSTLAKRGKEPSAPRKIGYGMIVAAAAFMILVIGSAGLMTPNELKAAGVSDRLVSPDWLIYTYLSLTFAELLLSPMGISFVSKVAPPRYKGAMMGCWFAATAVGNYLVSVVGYLWGPLPLWCVWGLLMACCLLSAAIIFSLMKRIEAATK